VHTVKSSGNLSITLAVLFLLPFCVIGVVAMVFAVQALAEGDTERAGFLAIFGLAFGGAGFGFLAALLFGRRLVLKEQECKLQHPDAPWKWREDWAEGKVRSAGLPAVWAAWIFALIWNTVSSSLVFFIPQMLEEGNLPALIALIFPLAGLFLIYRAVRLTVQRWRFGQSIVHLDTHPGVIGGRLSGTLAIPSGFPPDAKMTLRLTCVHRQRTGGRGNSTSESIVWQEEAPPASVYGAGGAATIPFSFAIPADAKPSDTSGEGTGILWRLSTSAQIPGVDYEADFDVPVFAGAPGAQAYALAAGPPGDVGVPSGSAATPGPLPEGLTVRPGPDGGTEFVLHRWRNVRVALGIASFTVLWTAVVVLMIVLGAPVFFPLVFGFFDVLLIWMIIHLWAGEMRVTIDPTGLTIHPRLPLLSSATTLPPGRVTDVRLSIGMQSGNAVFYNLELAGPGGTTVAVPAFLRNKRDAERVAVLMKQLLASTHNLRTGQ
jgi:hypothetical protein